MTYIENIFICMASPLLIAALCMGKRQTKFFLFCLAGIGACLLSAYINTFLAALYGADTFGATAEIAPVVEEVMKLLPLLFYLLVFEPKAEQIKIAAVITALSFATFENVLFALRAHPGVPKKEICRTVYRKYRSQETSQASDHKKSSAGHSTILRKV